MSNPFHLAIPAGDLNTARYYLGGTGTTTAGLVMTGGTSSTADTADSEEYNGTSWTEIADVGTAMVRGGGAGSGGTSGIKFGGSTPSVTASTEEFTAADFTINPVTTS